MNIVGGSYKRHDALLEAQAIKIFKAISDGELMTGIGLNQESGLARASDTRWGITLCHFDELDQYVSISD